MQFFAIVVVDVSADMVELSGTAKGTIVVPVPVLTEYGTETRQDVSVEAELPVTFSMDGKAAASVRYEFNDEEILTHYPVETWGSGKHVLPLYYPIENLIPNFTNTFNVYLKMSGGSGSIETGGCIASMSGQGMAAAPAWDSIDGIEWNGSLLPICPNMIGGILLFSQVLEEDMENIYSMSGNLPVAYASNNVNSTANTARGSLNQVESKKLDNGYKFVWEFTPSQGNGTIAAAALTSAKGGENGYGSLVNDSSTFLQLKSVGGRAGTDSEGEETGRKAGYGCRELEGRNEKAGKRKGF